MKTLNGVTSRTHLPHGLFDNQQTHYDSVRSETFSQNTKFNSHQFPDCWRVTPQAGSRWATTPGSSTASGTARCSPPSKWSSYWSVIRPSDWLLVYLSSDWLLVPGVSLVTWPRCWLATTGGASRAPAWAAPQLTRSSTIRSGWQIIVMMMISGHKVILAGQGLHWRNQIQGSWENCPCPCIIYEYTDTLHIFNLFSWFLMRKLRRREF